MVREAPRLVPPDGVYDEFCARFPYDETEDQQRAIEAALDDLVALQSAATAAQQAGGGPAGEERARQEN